LQWNLILVWERVRFADPLALKRSWLERTEPCVMDQALLEMANAAERGADLPGICLFTGSLSVFGVPASSLEAAELMRQSMFDAMYRAEKPRLRRRRDEVAEEARSTAEAYLSQFKEGLSSQSGAISLKAATMVVTPTGERITVPALRVALALVNSWFVGDFKSSGVSGGGVFGLVSLSVD
jgi:hypothetical protein